MLVKAGEQLDGFAQLRDDGTTACGCWIFTGAWTSKGNMMARRDNSDPSGLGSTLGWGFSWPANRRILYNAASNDPSGKPWDPKRKVIWWNGQKWTGVDVPDFKVDSPPEAGMTPFIMNPEGVARLFALDKMAEGPVPRALRAARIAAGSQPAAPEQPRGAGSTRQCGCSRTTATTMGEAKDFPYVATTYRLTEHFHFWTKHARINAILQPRAVRRDR